MDVEQCSKRAHQNPSVLKELIDKGLIKLTPTGIRLTKAGIQFGEYLDENAKQDKAD